MTDTERIPSTIKLARAMQECNCPQFLVDLALQGEYDDFKSSHEMPKVLLLETLRAINQVALIDRVVAGEFDSQSWEAEEWAASPQGKKVTEAFTPEIRKKLFGA